MVTMILRLSIALLICMAGTAWGDSWRAGPHTDSVKASWLRQDQPYYNYGGDDDIYIGGNSAANSTMTVIQPQVDGRQGGYTRDSGLLYLVWTSQGVSDPNGSTESCKIAVYALARAWVEGTATAVQQNGSCSWDTAGATAWDTPGAKNTTTDRQADAFDTVWAHGINDDLIWWETTHGYGPDTAADGDTIIIHIPGAKVDAVVTYGLILDRVNAWGGTNMFHMQSDNNTADTATWFQFWETAPAAEGNAYGAGTYGAGTFGEP